MESFPLCAYTVETLIFVADGFHDDHNHADKSLGKTIQRNYCTCTLYMQNGC